MDTSLVFFAFLVTGVIYVVDMILLLRRKSWLQAGQRLFSALTFLAIAVIYSGLEIFGITSAVRVILVLLALQAAADPISHWSKNHAL